MVIPFVRRKRLHILAWGLIVNIYIYIQTYTYSVYTICDTCLKKLVLIV